MGCKRKKESQGYNQVFFGLSKRKMLPFIDTEKAMSGASFSQESWDVSGL